MPCCRRHAAARRRRFEGPPDRVAARQPIAAPEWHPAAWIRCVPAPLGSGVPAAGEAAAGGVGAGMPSVCLPRMPCRGTLKAAEQALLGGAGTAAPCPPPRLPAVPGSGEPVRRERRVLHRHGVQAAVDDGPPHLPAVQRGGAGVLCSPAVLQQEAHVRKQSQRAEAHLPTCVRIPLPGLSWGSYTHPTMSVPACNVCCCPTLLLWQPSVMLACTYMHGNRFKSECTVMAASLTSSLWRHIAVACPSFNLPPCQEDVHDSGCSLVHDSERACRDSGWMHYSRHRDSSSAAAAATLHSLVRLPL